LAYLAHPGTSSIALAVCHRGRYVFTAGGSDATVHAWEVNVDALEAAARIGGEGFRPFREAVDKIDPRLFEEFNDAFYYSGLRAHGVNNMRSRKTPLTVPYSEIPFLMRAVGFYPSELEVTEMLNEVTFNDDDEDENDDDDDAGSRGNGGSRDSLGSRDGERSSTKARRKKPLDEKKGEINLEQLVRLFINHRPVFGYDMDSIATAFSHLAAVTREKGETTSNDELMDMGIGAEDATLTRASFLDCLRGGEERIEETELKECLESLWGSAPEGGKWETQPTRRGAGTVGTVSSGNGIGDGDRNVLDQLPRVLNAKKFACDVLDLGLRMKSPE